MAAHISISNGLVSKNKGNRPNVPSRFDESCDALVFSAAIYRQFNNSRGNLLRRMSN